MDEKGLEILDDGDEKEGASDHSIHGNIIATAKLIIFRCFVQNPVERGEKSKTG